MVDVDLRLWGKVALITGASRGIGRAMARIFTKEGAKIAVNYNRSDREALSLVEEIRGRGGEALPVKADVSKAEEVKWMIRETVEKFGRIDILVNNAGMILPTPFEDFTEEIWDRTLDVNLKGAFLCSKEVAPIMLKQKSGKIINISSIAGLGHRVAKGNIAYIASKSGMIGLTRSLAVELAPHVNVNAICPGMIETDMAASLNPERKKIATEQALLKRLGKPEEIANAALFLASEESNFITGEIITVAGGRAMR